MRAGAVIRRIWETSRPYHQVGGSFLHPWISNVYHTDSLVCLLWPKGSAGSHKLLPLPKFQGVCGNGHLACLFLRLAIVTQP